MNGVITFIIVFLVLIGVPFIIVAFISLLINWRSLIWRNKGRVFRLVKEDNRYYPEKRFLKFFFIRPKDVPALSTEKESTKYIHDFLKTLEEEQTIKSKLLDFSNLILDPKRMIESKSLETKRIKCRIK